MKFIKVSDKQTIEQLKKDGFKIVMVSGDVVTFLYDEKLKFNKTDKIIFCNRLEFEGGE